MALTFIHCSFVLFTNHLSTNDFFHPQTQRKNIKTTIRKQLVMNIKLVLLCLIGIALDSLAFASNDFQLDGESRTQSARSLTMNAFPRKGETATTGSAFTGTRYWDQACKQDSDCSPTTMIAGVSGQDHYNAQTGRMTNMKCVYIGWYTKYICLKRTTCQIFPSN